jgi:hypothetical protein
MRGLMILGIVLLLGGLLALAYPAITYTTTEKVVDIGPVEVTRQEHERIPLPPILGGVAAAAGVALIAMNRGRTA